MRATTGSTTGRLTLTALTLGLLALAHPWNAVRADGRGSDDRDDRLDHMRVIGLTDDGRLVRFRAGSPRSERDLGHVWGLTGADSALIGIDFRVQNGNSMASATAAACTPSTRRPLKRRFVNSLDGRLIGNELRRRLQSRRRSPPDRQRRRPEPRAQRERRTASRPPNGTLTYTPPPATPVAAAASRAPRTRTTTSTSLARRRRSSTSTP